MQAREGLTEHGRAVILEGMDCAAAITDLDGRVRWLNPAAGRLLGRTPASFLALDARAQWAIPDRTPLDRARLVRTIVAGQPIVVDGSLSIDGRTVPVTVDVRPFAAEDGIGGAALVITDRSSDAQRELGVQEARAGQQLIGDLSRRLLEEDLAGGLLDLLERLRQMVGVDAAAWLRIDESSVVEVLGDHMAELRGAALSGLPWCARAVEERTTVHVVDGLTDGRFDTGREMKVLGLRSAVIAPVVVDGVIRSLLFVGSTNASWDAHLVNLLDTAADLIGSAVARQQHDENLRQQLVTDIETGLPGAAVVDLALGSALRSPSGGTVVIVRLRRYDDVAAAYGGRQAAQFLTVCAQQLDDALGVTTCRVGTGELGFVDMAGRADIGDLVHATLAGPLPVRDGLRALADPVVGVCQASRHTTAAAALTRARAALAVAAVRADDPPVPASESLVLDTAQELGRALALEEAIADRRIVIHTQAGRRLTDRAPRWAEVLVRFSDTDLADIPVQEVIATAERTGAIHQLGLQVMRAAALLRQRLGDLGPELLSINLSAVQLRSEDLPEKLEKIVRRVGCAPAQFALELTETAIMHDLDRAGRVVHALADAGFTLMIDDFGAGTSTIRKLVDLPFDVLKIDRALVAGIHTDPRRHRLLASTIDLGLGQDKLIVVEGIETPDDAAAVARLGADIAQGYCFSRPGPPEIGVLECADWSVWKPPPLEDQ
jgi:EAL domain-containing protein (putative c-di-GMP-specific phosphodiesterase class I)